MSNSPEIIIIGGGPAGLAAAIAAFDGGCRDILILERERNSAAFCGSASILDSACTGSRRNSLALNTRIDSFGRWRSGAFPSNATRWCSKSLLTRT